MIENVEAQEQMIEKLLPLAENGDARSQYHLAVLCHDGNGTPKDYVQAAYWYHQAAEQGHDKAQLYLGLLYLKGYGVPQSKDEAVKWLTLSSENGNDKAGAFLDEILNADTEDDNTRSPSKPLIFAVSAAVVLFIAVMFFALVSMNSTDDVTASRPVHVKTLPSDLDDALAPPISSTLNPNVFSITEKAEKAEKEILVDLTIKDDSGKTASDYAKESGKNSETRESDVFEKLTESPKAIVDISVNTSERNIRSGKQQAEKLLKAKKISPFVRDTGTFEFNTDYENGNVEIAGTNVRMRKQPNTKSRIVKTVNRISANESLKYLGEWTSPQGDRWVICSYKENQKIRDTDARIIWIFGDYARLIPER